MNKLIFLLAIILVSCVNQPTPLTTEDNKTTSGDTKTQPVKAEFAMRNYQQIISTYSSLTGIPAGLKVIRIETDRTKASLPIGHESTSYNPFNQIAITSLALIYCSEWVKLNTSGSRIFGIEKVGNYKDQIISQLYLRLASTPEEDDLFLSEGRPMIKDAMNTTGSIFTSSTLHNEVVLGCGMFLGSLYFVADGD